MVTVISPLSSTTSPKQAVTTATSYFYPLQPWNFNERKWLSYCWIHTATMWKGLSSSATAQPHHSEWAITKLWWEKFGKARADISHYSIERMCRFWNAGLSGCWKLEAARGSESGKVLWPICVTVNQSRQIWRATEVPRGSTTAVSREQKDAGWLWPFKKRLKGYIALRN